MDMWQTIVIGIIFVYLLHQLEKRIKRHEEESESGWTLSVDALGAVAKYKKFGEVTGIKSAKEGKAFEDWSKTDRDKWVDRYAKDIVGKLLVNLTYLASEKAYFIRHDEGNTYIIHRDSYTTNTLLYSSTIIEDKKRIIIEFLIYDRLSKGVWMLVPGFRYRFDEGIIEKSEFTVLCEFPYSKEDEKLKELGFKISRIGGDDVYKDSFGDMRGIPTTKTYEKNGIRLTYR